MKWNVFDKEGKFLGVVHAISSEEFAVQTAKAQGMTDAARVEAAQECERM